MQIIEESKLLDHGPLRPFQRRILILCLLATTLDGMDVPILGLAVPSLARDWGVSPADFAMVAAAGLVGMAFGTTGAGILGDRFGPKRLLGLCLILFGAMTALSSLAESMLVLGVMRFLAGIGLGGALPNSVSLVAEYVPLRNRAFWIASLGTGTQVGGVIAGLIAARVLPTIGWSTLFVICGIVPMFCGAAILFMIPESLRHLLTNQPHTTAQARKVLALLDVDPGTAPFRRAETDTVEAGPLAALFGREHLRSTLTLWACFIAFYTSMYLVPNWLPSVLIGAGFDISSASLGLASYNLFGIGGGLLGGWLIVRHGTRRPLQLLTSLGAVWALALAVLLGSGVIASQPMLMLVIAVQGVFVIGILVSLTTILSVTYPPAVRSTGAGAAFSVARVGAVLSSFVGAAAVSSGGGSAFFVAIAAGLLVACLLVSIFRRHALPARGSKEIADRLQAASATVDPL